MSSHTNWENDQQSFCSEVVCWDEKQIIVCTWLLRNIMRVSSVEGWTVSGKGRSHKRATKTHTVHYHDNDAEPLQCRDLRTIILHHFHDHHQKCLGIFFSNIFILLCATKDAELSAKVQQHRLVLFSAIYIHHPPPSHLSSPATFLLSSGGGSSDFKLVSR